MKFNWGHGITLFYIIFVGTLATVLIKSFSVDHSLVVEDYYAKDIAYQQQYDKTVNSLNTDHLEITYDQNSETVIFNLNDAVIAKGTIEFYRASDKSQDFKVDITANDMNIPVDHLADGKWRVKVDWVLDGKSFYQEKDFYF